MSTPSRSARPMSPHIGVYRWQYTMTLSILHRITGVALSIGLLFLVYWLVALVSGPEAYADAQVVFANPLISVAFVGFSFAFFYHLANGVRHLMWDTIHGIERKGARLSGWIAFLTALVLTLVFWVIVLNRFGEAAV